MDEGIDIGPLPSILACSHAVWEGDSVEAHLLHLHEQRFECALESRVVGLRSVLPEEVRDVEAALRLHHLALIEHVPFPAGGCIRRKGLGALVPNLLVDAGVHFPEAIRLVGNDFGGAAQDVPVVPANFRFISPHCYLISSCRTLQNALPGIR